MARDDNPSFDELVALAVETGREGVKALKAKPVEKAAPAPVQAAAPKAAAPLKPMGPNDYMVIGLARIDDRLIHGQVATQWTSTVGANLILVANDEVSSNKMRQNLMNMAAPQGVATRYFSIQKTIDVIHKAAARQHIFIVVEKLNELLVKAAKSESAGSSISS